MAFGHRGLPLGYSRLVVDANTQPVIVNEKPLILGRGQLKGDQHHVILIPGEKTEQSAVRYIFEKRAAKWGLRAIARGLNRMGLKTLKGEPWKQTTVRSCLNNIVYLGHTRYGVRRKYNGIKNQIEGVKRTRNPVEEIIVIENTHEPLSRAELFGQVSQTFKKCAERFHSISGGQRRLMLFSSAIKCSHCGACYQCRPRKKGGKVYEYYECSGPNSGRATGDCDGWSVNAETLKKYIFGEIKRHVSTAEFKAALRAYLIGRLGQVLRGEVLDTRQLDRELHQVEEKKRRIIDSIAEGVLDRRDPLVAQKLQDLNQEQLILKARREEITQILGHDVNPDLIANQFIERVGNLTEFLDSLDVEEQRKALFAFCKEIVADSNHRRIVIKTDLTGLAQNVALTGVPSGLCINDLPE